MSESSRLTQILLDVIDRVKHRGLSTKVLWTNFSNGSPVPRAEFDRKLSNYGLQLRPGDLDIIWANIGARGSMNYSDFVRFINMDKIDANIYNDPPPRETPPPPTRSVPAAMRDSFEPDPVYDPPPRAAPRDDYGMGRGYSDPLPPRDDYPPSPSRSNESLASILVRCKQQIANALMDRDPTVSGFISAYDFENIIQRISLVNSSDIARLIKSYDTENTGFFNYFTLLSDLCNQIGPDPGMARAPPRRYDPPPVDDYYQPSPPRARPADDYGMSSYGRPPADDYYGMSPPRARAPPADDYQPRNVSRQVVDDYYPAAQSRADEIVKEIAAKMDTVYDSSQTCFTKWRGYSKELGPSEFVAGAKRDFQIDVTLAEADEIIRKYGGNMTLGNFMKMMGAGQEAVTQQRRQRQSTELDDNQKTILHIARQVSTKKEDWRGVFRASDSVERLVTGLRSINVYVLLNDLRPAWNKYGKDGIERMVDEFLGTL